MLSLSQSLARPKPISEDWRLAAMAVLIGPHLANGGGKSKITLHSDLEEVHVEIVEVDVVLGILLSEVQPYLYEIGKVHRACTLKKSADNYEALSALSECVGADLVEWGNVEARYKQLKTKKKTQPNNMCLLLTFC